MDIQYIIRENKIQLAYKLTQHISENDQLAGVVFLPGFKSDMQGSKVTFLEGYCEQENLDFLRFDYSGHGQSEGKFKEGTIGSWYKDAEFLIEGLTDMPQVLIGSSMGGWIALLLAVRRPDLVKGLILIAPAPDFTKEVRKNIQKAGQIDLLNEKGYIETPSGYEEPYIFTKKLLDDGDDHLLMKGAINYDGPVRILQGKQDSSVRWQKAEEIKSVLTSYDIEIDFIEDGDHSLSRPNDLKILAKRVKELT